MTDSRDPPDFSGDIPFPDDDLPASQPEREPGSDDDTPMSDEAVSFFRLPQDEEDMPLPEERFEGEPEMEIEDNRPISQRAAPRRPIGPASSSTTY